MYQRLAEAPAATASGTHGRWDAAPDLERFLCSFYRYFEVKGYRGVLAAHLSHLVALAFTICFSFVLLFFVNWQAVLSCDSEESCRAVLLCYSDPFSQVSLWRSIVLLSFFLFFVYWIFNVVAAYQSVKDAAEISAYYKDRLGIVSDDILATMSWSEVVSRLVEQQKASPFCIVQDELTALEVANIIMREDNFLIAFTNHCTFTSRIPSWIPHRLVHTRSVLQNLRAAVFNYIFDSRSRIRADFLERPAALAQRLRWLGLLNLLLVVPVIIFVTIYFFMRHAEEFRSHRSSPFQRQWTDFARWTFREFNELPHQFKARMTRAQQMAEAYVRITRTPSPVLESLQRCVKYIAGSILAVLLVVALWDETPLLFVKIQDKNLLWYLACFGFIFALADSAEEVPAQQFGTPCPPSHHIRQPHIANTPLQMHCALMRLVKCTHHLPPSWRLPVPLRAMAGNCGGGSRRARLSQHFAQIRLELLQNFFVHRIQVLIEELLGVILTPVLLIVYLPQAAADIVEIVQLTKHSSPNLGDWCGFGCLDPSRNGSEVFTMNGTLVSNGGKLEKSVISFILAHRVSWSMSGGSDGFGDEDMHNVTGGCGSTNGVPVLRPSLKEEMRRGLLRLASASSETYQQLAASSGMACGSESSQRLPLLSKASESEREIPLTEFHRVPRMSDPDTVHFDSSASWSEPGLDEADRCPRVAGPSESSGYYPPDTFQSFSVATPTNDQSDDSYYPPETFQSFSVATPTSNYSHEGTFVDACEVADGEDMVASMIDDGARKVWGYPASALQLLYKLEEFQQLELSPASSHAGVYALLPEDVTSASGGSLSQAAPCIDWYDELDQGNCSSHFFWLEMFYDHHRGSHSSSLHQGGRHANYSVNPGRRG